MEIVKGQVISNQDPDEQGTFWAMFPTIGPDAYKVTYTSPFFKVNAGGFLAIPAKGDQILAAYNEYPEKDESEFYYHSTIVAKTDIKKDDEDDKFETIPRNDAPPYDASGHPTMQHFTNHAGAGLYIKREFTPDKIDNNVTIKAEGGEEVTVSPVGVQIKNADGDSIILNGSEPNEGYGYRSLAVETWNSHEYKCIAGDINMRLIDGGDINIENNSFGLFSIPPWFGNVRMKSRWRDVTLAALGPTSNIHIVTNTGKIKVNGATGQVSILGTTNVDIASPGTISMNAGGAISLNAGGAVSINAGAVASLNANGAASINSNALVSMNGPVASVNGGQTTVQGTANVNVLSNGAAVLNGATCLLNNTPIITVNPTGGDVSVVQDLPGAPPTASPPLPAVPSPPVIIPPVPNDYLDGIPGSELGGAV